MLHLVTIAVATLNLAAAPDAGVFKLKTTDPASRGPVATASKLVPTKTEAAMKFFVVEKDKAPVKGAVAGGEMHDPVRVERVPNVRPCAEFEALGRTALCDAGAIRGELVRA